MTTSCVGSATILFEATDDRVPYTFQGARGRVAWPRRREDLAPGGIWNLLWRIGLIASEPTSVFEDTIFPAAVTFVTLTTPAGAGAFERIFREGEAGERWVVVSGTVEALAQFLPIRPMRLNWGAGIALDSGDGTPRLFAPPGAPIFAVDGGTGWERFWQCVAISGERQSPTRAIVQQLADAPFAVRKGRLLILNGDPFGAYQGWLQGHDDLALWLGWRSRLSWLDELALDHAGWLEEIAPGLLSAILPSSIDLPERTVVLRHDLDNSNDHSFLEEELAAGIPATHAVLDNANAHAWVQTLSMHPEHEIAFHYDTGRKANTVDFLKLRMCGQVVPIRDDRARIVAGGLARQINKVRPKGVIPRTLHRHLSFIYYPELIDALDDAAERFGVLGGSSYFIGRVLRFGAPVGETIACERPDVQFPIWFPFRPWNPATGRLLSAFEGSMLLEPEPSLVKQVLAWSGARSLRRVVTICYHPAHANTDTIAQGGTRAWLRTVIQEAKEAGWIFLPLVEVYARCKQASDKAKGVMTLGDQSQ